MKTIPFCSLLEELGEKSGFELVELRGVLNDDLSVKFEKIKEKQQELET